MTSRPCSRPSSAVSSLHASRPASGTQRARILVDGREAGWIGELHPAWQQKYEIPAPVLLFEVEASALAEVSAARLPRAVSKFPPVRRDLAVVVDESVPVRAMLEALRAGLPPSVESVDAFDLYRGKGVENGKKSLAFRVLLQDTQKTLTDAEVDETMALALLQILQARVWRAS